MVFVLLALNIPFVSVAMEEQVSGTDLSEISYPQTDFGNISVEEEPIHEYEISADDGIWKLGPDEKTFAELQTIRFEDVEFPEVISVERAKEKGHVNRLKAQEKTLNSIIYQNRGGGKTAYIYSYPVKYYDADGNVRDRSTRIESAVKAGYAYSMWDNSVQAHFSQNSSGGIMLSSGKISIKMTPVSPSVGQNAVQLNDNTVAYGKVFDGSAALVYTSLMSGVKEDIVLSRFNGQSSFEFLLEADGLTVHQQNNGIWVFKFGDTVVAEFGRIIINDSAGNTVYGEMDIESASDGNYLISVIAPLDFLQSEETVYPVYIDPTLHIFEVTYYYNGYDSIPHSSIIDVGLYETQDDYDYNWDTNHIFILGSCDGMEGEGRIIYKLPDFYNSEYGLYTDMRSEQIASARLYIETLSDEGMYVYAYPMTDTYSGWGEEPEQVWNAELSEAYAADKGIQSYLTSTGLQEVEITSIVKGWADYNNGLSSAAYDNPANGLVLAASNPENGVSIRSTEYGNANNNAYVVMDYSNIGGEYYIFNNAMGVSWQGDPIDDALPYVAKLSATASNRWVVEYIGDGKHSISSAVDTNYLFSAMADIPCFLSRPSVLGIGHKWQFISGGGGFRIKSELNGKYLYTNGHSRTFVDSTDTSDGSKWGILLKSDYVPITDIALNDNWLKPGQTKYFDVKATPSNASLRGDGNFTWTVSDNSIVTTTSSTAQLRGVSAGKITLTLTHKLTGYTKSFTIVCGPIREGTYMIMNKGTGRYMDVEGPSMASGAYIQQWDYHTDAQARWIVTMHYDGSYCIMSGYSANYVTVNNSSSVTGAAIVQSETFADEYSMWNVVATSSGAYKILSAANPILAISVPTGDNQNGTNLILSMYVRDTNYYDEWIFDDIGETPGIVNGGIYNIQAVHSQKVIDVEYGATADGTNISQYPLTSGYQWQRWKFSYVGNGEYKIYDMNSGKLLSVANNSPWAEANIELRAGDGSMGQRFKIRKNTDCTYTFLSKCSSYLNVLSIADSSLENSANLEQNYDNGTSNQKFNLIESNKAIIIVPGILGSELYVGEGNPYFAYDMPLFHMELFDTTSTYQTGDTVEDLIPQKWWQYVTNIPSAIQLFHAWHNTMQCNEDGTSKYNVYVKEYRKNFSTTTRTDNCGVGNFYATLYDKLEKSFSNDYVIEFFSYDWRLSNAVSAEKLDAYINRYGYEEVVLVAHSMGGLVAAGYTGLGAEQRSKVSQIYCLAAPLLGVPEVANVWYNEDISFVKENFGEMGEDLFIVLNLITTVANPIQTLISNYVSVYELLPSEYYFILADSSYMSETVTSIIVGGTTTTTECATYTSTKNVLTEQFNYFDPDLMLLAETFHDNTFVSNVHFMYDVDIYFYAYRERDYEYDDVVYKQNTTSKVTFFETVSDISYSTGLDVVGYNVGDGLVLPSSATLNNNYPLKTTILDGGHMTPIKSVITINQIINNIQQIGN